MQDIYAREWIDADKDCRKNLVIVQANLQQPVTIKISGFLEVNMEVFLAIMNTAFKMISVFLHIK